MVHLKQQNQQLKEKLLKVASPVQRLEGDDCQTHFYTGLPLYAVFMSLLTSLSAVVPTRSSGFGLQAGDKLLLVLMKLKLAVPHEDVAYRFGIDIAKVSKVFHLWIDFMSREMQQLVCWPDREIIRQNLPGCFKPNYKHTTCIIDCTEVFIECPTSLVA